MPGIFDGLACEACIGLQTDTCGYFSTMALDSPEWDKLVEEQAEIALAALNSTPKENN